MTFNYTALKSIPAELCTRQLVTLDLSHNLLASVPSALWRLSALNELSLEDNMLTSLDPRASQQDATAEASELSLEDSVLTSLDARANKQADAEEGSGLANLKILNIAHNRIASSAGLELLVSLKALVELRFSPQQATVKVEAGLADAVESVPQDGGRTLHEFQLRQLEPTDEDNDLDVSEQNPYDEGEGDALAIVIARARQDPLTPPITAIIASTIAAPSPAPSHRLHAKQEEVGKRVFELIEKRLLAGASVASLGERFDDVELVVAVPELNSLFSQTQQRVDGFAQYYLSTRGRHFYAGLSDGQRLPSGAVFKVGAAAVCVPSASPGRISARAS